MTSNGPDPDVDLYETPGVLEQIRQAEANIEAGLGIDADQLRREFKSRLDREMGWERPETRHGR